MLEGRLAASKHGIGGFSVTCTGHQHLVDKPAGANTTDNLSFAVRQKKGAGHTVELWVWILPSPTSRRLRAAVPRSRACRGCPSRDSAGEEAWLTGDLVGASDIFRMGCRSGSGPSHVSLCESVTSAGLPVPACTKQVLKHGTYSYPGSFLLSPCPPNIPRPSEDLPALLPK